MDCGLALRPLSCDVTGRGPTGQGRGGRLGLRKAEEDRALHPCRRRARACLHGLLGIRRRAADGFPRPGRGLRGAPSRPPYGLHAGRRRRGREHRPLLPLLVNVSPDEADHDIADPTNPITTGTADLQANIDRGASNGLEVMLTIRTAPAWAERGGAARGDVQPRPGYLKSSREPRRPLQATSRSGASGTSRTTRRS